MLNIFKKNDAQNKIPRWIVLSLAITGVVAAASVAFAIYVAVPKFKLGRQLETARSFTSEMNYAEAVEAYENAIGIDSSSADAYIELADVYIKQNDYAKAKKILDEALENVAQKDIEKVEEKQGELETAVAKASSRSSVNTDSTPTSEPVTSEPDEPQTSTSDVSGAEDTKSAQVPSTEPLDTSTSEQTVDHTPEPVSGPTDGPTPKPDPGPTLPANPTDKITDKPKDNPTVPPTATPTDPPTDTPTPTPSAEDKLVAKLKSAKKGKTIYFGSYEQDNKTKNGKEDIEWIVLSNDGSELFIISKYALACKPYNDTRKEVTWEKSSLRKWLNGDFYKDAFSKTEQNVIKSVTIKNKANPENGTSGGNDTKDKIFLPSIADMVNTGYGYTSEYSSENGDMMVNRRCAPTKYAIAKGVLTYTSHLTAEGDAVCYWWLRSPGIDNTCAVIVSSRGEINCDGSTVDYQLNGVRPVLKIKLK